MHTSAYPHLIYRSAGVVSLSAVLLAGCQPAPLLPPNPSPAVQWTPSPGPATGPMLHGVYPGGISGAEDDLTLQDLRSYEETVGKPAAWVYFSNNWYADRRFPAETAAWICAAGSLPYVRLMLRSDIDLDHAEPVFYLQGIIDGDFDADLAAWADGAREFGTPILAEFGTEMNGEWFSWNGAWNGAGQMDGYGAPDLPDGPERFKDAYRHIIRICRERGADNIRWVFHANGSDWPQDAWNRLENYYPGDEWIDWLAVSIYAGQSPQDEEWPVFREVMDEVYPRLASLSPEKPIIVAEFGAAAGNPRGDAAAWAAAALTDLTGRRWPRVRGFSWWNERWPNDDDPAHDTTMRVQDNPALAEVFHRLVGDNPSVLGRTDLEE